MASYNRFLSGHAIHLRQRLPVSEVERCEVELSGSMGKRTAAASSLLSLHESFLPEAAPSDDFETLQSRVEAARCKVPGCGTVLNLVAAFNLAFRALLSFDSVLGCVIAVASVILYGRGGASVGLSFGLDWNLVSMAVIFPISQCIGWSFGRREMALSLLSTVMSLVTRLWSAVHTWKVKDGGEWRRMSELLEPPAGREQLHDLFGRLLSTLVAYFAVPRYMRLRHVMRLYGAAEDQARRHALANEFKLLVDGSLSQLQARRGRYAGPPGGARRPSPLPSPPPPSLPFPQALVQELKTRGLQTREAGPGYSTNLLGSGSEPSHRPPGRRGAPARLVHLADRHRVGAAHRHQGVPHAAGTARLVLVHVS